MIAKAFKYWFVFYILLFIEGCKKDPKIDTNLGCEKLPPTPPLGWVFQTRNPQLNIQEARYSTLNDNLIFYLSHDSIYNYLLWSFNKQTKIKKLLDNNVFSSPSINKSGWIVYYKSDFNIYKIKINGDSLTQLTTSGGFFYPVWDETGTNIYFNNANKPALYKMTNLGSIIDTAKDIKSRVFVKDSLIVFIENYNNATNFMLKNIKQNSIKKIFTFSFDEDIIYDFFLNTNNSSLFFFGGKGLYKLNMQDNSFKKVISNCDKELFIDFSMSYLSNKLLATKITTKVLSNTTLYNQYDIYEFDENQSNPAPINTP